MTQSVIKYCNSILKGNDRCGKYKKKTRKCKHVKTCKQLFQKYNTKSAPRYNKKKWSHPVIEGSHNCYVYALDDINEYTKAKCIHVCKQGSNVTSTGLCKRKERKCSRFKPQPGKYAFYNNKRSHINRTYTCDELKQAILDDNPHITEIPFNKKPKKGYYKIGLVIEPNSTYHFYRLDRRGKWSHKPGTEPITDKDASGYNIYVPHLADRNYNKQNNGGINYTQFCYYFSVPANKTAPTMSK